MIISRRLRHVGVDVIFIEKEGIVEKLTPFTTGLGIALVHSEGFYAEYAEMLADEALKLYREHWNIDRL